MTEHFTNRLAAHLADVRNTDARSRIVRTEAEQKVEALTRMCFEMHRTIAGLAERLPGDLRARIDAAVFVGANPFVALIDVIAPKPDEPCEACGETGCPA